MEKTLNNNGGKNTQLALDESSLLIYRLQGGRHIGCTSLEVVVEKTQFEMESLTLDFCWDPLVG